MKTRFSFMLIFVLISALFSSGQKNSSIQIVNEPNTTGQSYYGLNLLEPQLDRLLDSVYDYGWKDAAWSLKSKNHKYRNSNGWLTEDLYVVRNQTSGLWNNYVRYLYSYNNPNPDFTAVRGYLWTSEPSWLEYNYTHYPEKNRIDTTYTKEWNPLKQKFLSGTQEIYTYDAEDSVTNKLVRKLDTATGNWINNYQLLKTFTAFHKVAEEIFQSWDPEDSLWTNINRKTETFDASNFLTLHSEYVWNDTASNWDYISRTTYINDTTGNPLSSLTESWDNTQGLWLPYSQKLLIYNTLGWRLSEREQRYNQLTSTFDDFYLVYYTYFLSGTVESTTGNFWKPTSSEWITDFYHLIDSNLFFVEHYEKYHDNLTYEIIGGSRNTNTYNTKLQLTNELNQEWSVTSSDWVNKMQTDYSYNEFKLLDETIDQEWDIAGASWVNSTRSKYYYSEPYGIRDNTADAIYCSFANPLKSGTLISCPGFTTGEHYMVKVFSISGSMIYQQQFTGGSTFSLDAGLNQGYYLMQFSTASGKVLSTRKILILD